VFRRLNETTHGLRQMTNCSGLVSEFQSTLDHRRGVRSGDQPGLGSHIPQANGLPNGSERGMKTGRLFADAVSSRAHHAVQEILARRRLFVKFAHVKT
jgi:hypothetical protein